MKIKKYLEENYLILVILLIAAFLRFFNIGFQEPWLDELSTLQVSDPDLSYSETSNLVMTREGFSHLYFLSIKFVSAIFGHSIVVLRCFSAFFGLAGIYLSFLFLKELFNKRVGYIAAILLTVNFFHIFHSQEARVYSLMVFFIALASYRMVKYVKNASMLNAIYLGIACGLVPNSHPIALLNTCVIYATLFVFFMIEKEKVRHFKQLLVAGVLTIIIFSPMYWLFAKASEVTSFWIPPASFETIKTAFFELLGSTNYGLYIYILSTFCFFILIIFKIKNEKNVERKKLKIIALSLVFFWIIINIGIIIAKSYHDVSIILSRYFIGCLLMFILTLAYCISLIKNNYVRNILLSVFAIFSLYSVFNSKYYTTVRKAQWQSLANEISEKNTDGDHIYGAYGFTSNILFKNTPSYTLLVERKLEDYLRMVKNNTLEKESFWYFDGNFRPYTVTKEEQKFLDENYVLDIQIDKYDCWARHYLLKGSTQPKDGEDVFLNSFNPKVLDDEGRLYIFKNETISTKKLYLREGKYEFTLEANSLPAKPIDNINAHIVLKLDDKKIGEDFLSEKPENKLKKYTFKIADKNPKILSLTFDNDIAKGDIDRNVIIYFIKLRRIED